MRRPRGPPALILAVRRVAALVAAAVVVASGSVAWSASSQGATTRTALLLGDSLTTETAPDFVAPSGWRLVFDAYPGIAPCDWLDGPTPNATTFLDEHPAVVLIETAANDFTRCMRVRGHLPKLGSAQFITEYERSLTTLFEMARAVDARIVLLSPPPLLVPSRSSALIKIMLWAIDDEHVFVATGPRFAVSSHGLFRLRLPCLRGETAVMGCVGGLIAVRTVDSHFHLHFCPWSDDIVTGFTCSVYSSGQERWARATMHVLAGLP